MTYFKKPCRKCGKLFRPTGKCTKVCDKCKKKDALARKTKARKLSKNKFCRLCEKKITNPTEYQTLCKKCLKIIIKIAAKKRERVKNDKLNR